MGISNISCRACRVPTRWPAAGCRRPRAHICERSSLAHHATPENRLRPVRQEHAPRGLEVGAGLVEGGGGAALVLAPDASPDRSRTTIPTDRCRAGCRCGSRSCRRRNGPSARGHAEAVGGCVPGAQKHRQTIRRIALVPKMPIRGVKVHGGPS
jgi:hypothetical protein